MKNKMPVFVGILITVLVFGLMFSGCKTEDDVDVFEGTWRSSNTQGTFNVAYTFHGNEFTLTNVIAGREFHGTFTYTDTEITFKREATETTNAETYTQQCEFRNNGKVLFLARDEGSHFNGEFTKE
jgi:hypothetical protein